MKILMILFTASIILFSASTMADNDDHDDDDHFWSGWFQDDDKSSSKRGSRSKKRYMDPVTDPLYKKECGSCHWLFLPGLLPERSWRLVMSDLENHFGEDAFLEAEEKNHIESYLAQNAADKTNARRSRKIMRVMSNKDSPIRITKTSYLRHKHRELRAGIYQRKSIRSFSNCVACHPTADKGVFNDDYVRIPK